MNSDGLAVTRDALHAISEHVLAAALFAGTGRIGLRVVPGGFATPAFGSQERVIMLGPPSIPAADPCFTAPFGAARTWTQTPTSAHITAFFAEGAQRAAQLGSGGA
ncbi:MAG TPA: hypothetical protein VHX15_02480 [Frankiaceae bacterium]|jgi:hypothetical protein|nr:hypothetical protein [Frankiaceae bacterium]